jgi:hypothetical protein
MIVGSSVKGKQKGGGCVELEGRRRDGVKPVCYSLMLTPNVLPVVSLRLQSTSNKQRINRSKVLKSFGYHLKDAPGWSGGDSGWLLPEKDRRFNDFTALCGGDSRWLPCEGS